MELQASMEAIKLSTEISKSTLIHEQLASTRPVLIESRVRTIACAVQASTRGT